MRAAALNLNDNLVQCPFCRSRAEKLSALIVCSGCHTFYHRECWKQNQGCSVFGCTGIMIDSKKRSGEPRWLIALRIIVFGFILFCFINLKMPQSIFVDLLFALWAIIFMPTAPALLLAEIICLYQVYEHPELRSKYGRKSSHIISLTGYGLIIFLFFVTLLLLPRLI